MDGTEHDELLYRLDERTERIENEHMRRLEKVEHGVAQNREAITTLDDRVQKTETRIHTAMGALGAIGAAVLASIGKVFGLIKGF